MNILGREATLLIFPMAFIAVQSHRARLGYKVSCHSVDNLSDLPKFVSSRIRKDHQPLENKNKKQRTNPNVNTTTWFSLAQPATGKDWLFFLTPCIAKLRSEFLPILSIGKARVCQKRKINFCGLVICN